MHRKPSEASGTGRLEPHANGTLRAHIILQKVHHTGPRRANTVEAQQDLAAMQAATCPQAVREVARQLKEAAGHERRAAMAALIQGLPSHDDADVAALQHAEPCATSASCRDHVSMLRASTREGTGPEINSSREQGHPAFPVIHHGNQRRLNKRYDGNAAAANQKGSRTRKVADPGKTRKRRCYKRARGVSLSDAIHRSIESGDERSSPRKLTQCYSHTEAPPTKTRKGIARNPAGQLGDPVGPTHRAGVPGSKTRSLDISCMPISESMAGSSRGPPLAENLCSDSASAAETRPTDMIVDDRDGAPAPDFAAPSNKSTRIRARPTSKNFRKDAMVVLRILEEKWSTATAKGDKFLETQRYKTTHRGQMGFAKPGVLMVFGPQQKSVRKGATEISGVAVLAGESIQGRSLDITGVLEGVDRNVRDDLRTYLVGGGHQLFEYIKFAKVFDLRHLGMTWGALEEIIQVQMPHQRLGFPKLGNQAARDALMELCIRHGTVRRPQPLELNKENSGCS
jgi:hypothetical protein